MAMLYAAQVSNRFLTYGTTSCKGLSRLDWIVCPWRGDCNIEQLGDALGTRGGGKVGRP